MRVNRYLEERTGTSVALSLTRWCTDEGAPLSLDFLPQIDSAAPLQDRRGLWRYRPWLPLSPEDAEVSLGEPETPVVSFESVHGGLWLKQEQLLPTGTGSARGAALLVAAAKALGASSLVLDAFGRTGYALVAYAARASLGSELFVGEEVRGLEEFSAMGARIVRVSGGKEAVERSVREAAQTRLYASDAWSPWFLHGAKTLAYELWEQGFGSSDAVVLPLGRGAFLLGAFLGFRELFRAGILPRYPRLYGVRLEGASLEEHALPRYAEFLHAVQESGGGVLTIQKAQREEAWLRLRRSGFSVGRSSGAVLAGGEAVLEQLGRSARVVSVLTTALRA